MRWETKWLDDRSGSWIQADTATGEWSVEKDGDSFMAVWWPIGGHDLVRLGWYCTQGAAKGACKRYAKRMAAAFKAMGKAGWQ